MTNSRSIVFPFLVEPHNVDFKYIDGSYEIVEEINGNKINKTQFIKVINKYISKGRPILDLNKMQCYEVPKYTISSEKTLITKNKLNRYVSTSISYQFKNKALISLLSL